MKKIKQTGVTYVTKKAIEYGYSENNPEWINLGQGSPELDLKIDINKNLNIFPKYSPINGIYNLREYISKYYKDNYNLLCSKKNISICNGGRLAITRLMFLFNNCKIGCISPDYTAYSELLEIGSFNKIIELNETNVNKVPINDIIKKIIDKDIKVLLFSNPKNPTGLYYDYNELTKLINFIKKKDVTIIIDEMYSFYVYDLDKPISICKLITNIEDSNIILVNGITKNWKLPGLRLGWVLASETIIDNIESIGSFIDGGPNIFSQEIILNNNLLDIENVNLISSSIKKKYSEKKDYLIIELTKLGFVIDKNINSTFYIWASIKNLKYPLNEIDLFFDLCLNEKLICVPGYYFDLTCLNKKKSKFNDYVRFSYGKNINILKKGIKKLKKIILKNNL